LEESNLFNYLIFKKKEKKERKKELKEKKKLSHVVYRERERII